MTTDDPTKTSAAPGSEPDKTGTSPPADGARTVPESDFLAMKQSLEARINEAEGKLAASEKSGVELTVSLDRERVARVAAEAKATGFDALTTTHDELKTAHSELQVAHQTLTGQQLDAKRTSLVQKFGVDAEKLKDLSADQLATWETALASQPTKSAAPGPTGFDLTGNGTVDLSALTPREKIKHSIANEPAGQPS